MSRGLFRIRRVQNAILDSLSEGVEVEIVGVSDDDVHNLLPEVSGVIRPSCVLTAAANLVLLIDRLGHEKTNIIAVLRDVYVFNNCTM